MTMMLTITIAATRRSLTSRFASNRAWQLSRHCFVVLAISILATPSLAQSNRSSVRGQSNEVARPKTGEPRMELPSSSDANSVAGQDDLNKQLSLTELEQIAEDFHPILRRSRARVTSAQGQELQQGLYPNPRFDTNNPEVFNGQNSLFNAGFQQEIVTKGKLRLSKAAANKIVGQTELAFVSDRFSLLTSVRKQYYTTLAAQRRVDVVTDLKRITEDSLQVGKDLFEADQINKPDVLLLEVDYATVSADLASFKAKLEGERKQLSAIVGIPDLVRSRVKGNLAEKPPLFNEDNLKDFVTSNYAPIQIAKLEIERTKIVVKRQEVEAFPNVSVGPAFQQGILPGNQNFWLNVSFPIPTSNRNQGNIMSARADERAADESLSSLQLDLQNQVADLYSRHMAALAKAKIYRSKIIPDAYQMLALARDGFRNGVFDFPRFLQSQRTMVDVNMKYTDILEEVWSTASDLAGLLQVEQFP